MKWVLWIFFLGVWNLNGIPMTPGFMGSLIFDSAAECVEASKNERRPHVCTAADAPQPHPVVMTLKEYEARVLKKLGELQREKAF